VTPNLYELTLLDGRKVAVKEGTIVAIVPGTPGGGRKGCELLLLGGFKLEVYESLKTVADKIHATIRK
jgi:uncharacterized protein YlzI (FlbEa/FlbD family)